ncbi:MAG: hypothetical protein K8J08_18705 [Thermoanaerobaculia bacterium]|nr:hypothetical protein [Thermoanaerobaculia bacterium]
MRRRSVTWLWLLVLVAVRPAAAQDLCSDILQHGIFEKYELIEEKYLVSQAQSLYCSSHYSKEDSETKLGLDVAIIADGVPLELGGEFSERHSKEWRDEACKYDWHSVRDWSSLKVEIAKASDSIVNAWSKCMSERQGIAAGVTFSSPTDFILTVQINGLDAVGKLEYASTGIRVSPLGAAEFTPVNEFNEVKKTKVRKHAFRMKRADPQKGFDLLIASKPSSVTLRVPTARPENPDPVPPFKTTYLNTKTPTKIDGVYSITKCGRGTNGFTFANGKVYPSSVYLHPGPGGFSRVTYRVPVGATKLVLDGVGLCQDSSSGECNQFFPHAGWSVVADGRMLGEGSIGWPHDDARSVDAQSRVYEIKDADTIQLESNDRGNSGWCDHLTFLNPRFEP